MEQIHSIATMSENEMTVRYEQRSLVLERDGIRVEAAQSPAQLNDIAWNDLAISSQRSNPMLSHAWVSSFFEHRLTASDSWVVLLAFSSGELVGVAPIIIGTRSILRFGPRCLRTPADDHTPSVDFLTKRDGEKEILAALIDATSMCCGKNFALFMNRIPEQSPTVAGTLSEMNSVRVITDFDGIGSFLPIKGTFDDYIGNLSSNFRKNLRKASRKLGKLTDVEFRFLTGDDISEECLDIFTGIESSGWKGREGGAIASSPTLLAFYKTLSDRLHRAGWLEWHFLEVAGKTIAGQMAIRMGRTLVVNKISYDEDYSDVSPGNMLFLETVCRCFQDGDIDEINCLTDMPWHRNWRMNQRKYYNVHLFPNRSVSILLGEMPRRMRDALLRLPVMGPVLRSLKAIMRKQ
jgi:CelD/BcsL family acetyltransferase involved in cellulose biosynthesis